MNKSKNNVGKTAIWRLHKYAPVKVSIEEFNREIDSYRVRALESSEFCTVDVLYWADARELTEVETTKAK